MSSEASSSGSIWTVCFVLVLLMLAGASCSIRRWRDFKPVEKEEPVVLFGRYNVKLRGHASGPHTVECSVRFVNPLNDTMRIDTVPILVIDSMCFDGRCLDSTICLHPTSSYEIDERYRQDPNTTCTHFGTYIGTDLQYIYLKQVQPVDYFLYNKLRLPEYCDSNDVYMILCARLLDRVTNKEITQEAKRIQFNIRSRRRITMGS